MINLAVIGTNWISDRFVCAALQTKRFKLVAVYSRTLERAAIFGEKYSKKPKDILYYDKLVHFAQCDKIDAVYIASPNVLHAKQSLLMLQHNKHVICEKPIASTPNQLERMIKVANKQNRILFEAMKTYYLPNYKQIQKHLNKLGQLRHVSLNFCQYSSRYQLFLDGKNPNTFNLAFDNGSVMDIGVYCISFAVGLWGKPINVNASATLLNSGVDACGVIQLIFNQKNGDPFEVIIQHSKVSDGFIPSEIQGEQGALIIEHLSQCEQVTWIDRKSKEKQKITVDQDENNMSYEALVFADLIQNKMQAKKIKYNNDELLTRSKIVNQIVTEVRQQTGVHFICD